MAPKKQAPARQGVKGRLNRAYAYGQEHVFTVALVNLGIGGVLGFLVLLGFIRTGDIEKRVTKIESPCVVAPAGEKCQDSKQRSDEKRSVSSSCVLAYKLDKEGKLLRLTKCPVEPKRQKRIEAEEAADAKATLKGEPTASTASPNGGDAAQPSTARQPSSPSGGTRRTDSPSHPHGPSVPHQSPPKVPTESGGGGEAVPASPAPSSTSESPSGTSSSSTTERVKETVVESPAPPEAVPPVTTGLGEVLGGVGHVVTEPGATVEEVGHGADETVHEATCSVTGALGAPCDE